MDNLSIYTAVRKCPENALRKIQAGRLKGKSDINPMWRIKALTEQFGPAGIGWYYEITRQWMEQGANGEISAFCNISLYIKSGNEWSEPIQGTGGSAFVAKEKNGLYTSDECYKMALTDAISVACKALGFAADVYWDSDKTKYSHRDAPENEKTKEYKCVICGKPFEAFTAKKTGLTYTAGQAYHLSEKKNGGRALCKECGERERAKEKEKVEEEML